MDNDRLDRLLKLGAQRDYYDRITMDFPESDEKEYQSLKSELEEQLEIITKLESMRDTYYKSARETQSKESISISNLLENIMDVIGEDKLRLGNKIKKPEQQVKELQGALITRNKRQIDANEKLIKTNDKLIESLKENQDLKDTIEKIKEKYLKGTLYFCTECGFDGNKLKELLSDKYISHNSDSHKCETGDGNE